MLSLIWFVLLQVFYLGVSGVDVSTLLDFMYKIVADMQEAETAIACGTVILSKDFSCQG